MEYRSPEDRERRRNLKHASLLIAHALATPPKEMIRLVPEERAAMGVELPTAHTIAEIACNSLYRQRGIYLRGARSFLTEAIVDTGKIAEIIAIGNPTVSDEQLLATMSHPETIHAIAALALQTNSEMKSYLEERLKDTGVFSPDIPSFTVNDDQIITIEGHGCPAAGSHEEGVLPTPLFKKIIPWAVEVNLLSEEWDQFRATLSEGNSQNNPTSGIIGLIYGFFASKRRNHRPN